MNPSCACCVRQFSEEGSEYFMATDKRVSLHAAEGCEELIQLNHERRVMCMTQSTVRTALLESYYELVEPNYRK